MPTPVLAHSFKLLEGGATAIGASLVLGIFGARVQDLIVKFHVLIVLPPLESVTVAVMVFRPADEAEDAAVFFSAFAAEAMVCPGVCPGFERVSASA